MACDLWGESPLYENDGLKEGSIPTVTPIEKALDEGGHRPQVARGEVTNRGEEACECAGNLTKNRCQAHSRQSREATCEVGQVTSDWLNSLIYSTNWTGAPFRIQHSVAGFACATGNSGGVPARR